MFVSFVKIKSFICYLIRYVLQLSDNNLGKWEFFLRKEVV